MEIFMEFEKLQQIIAEVLNIDADEITMNTTFVDDLGADSLDVFQIIMGIEEEFDIEIPTEAAEKIVSVGDAVEQIKNALSGAAAKGILRYDSFAPAPFSIIRRKHSWIKN